MLTLRNKPGFTLLETIIALGIFAILVLGAGVFVTDVFRYNRSLSNGLDAERAVQRMLVGISRELRTASPSSLGSYSIETATATSLTFYANIDNDTYKERLRYFISGSNLRRGVLKPTGNPLIYNSANEQVSTVAENVTNTDLFTYYDQNYDGTSAPLSFPVTTTSIRLVTVRLVVDREPTYSPIPYEGVTSVEIRNLKTN